MNFFDKHIIILNSAVLCLRKVQLSILKRDFAIKFHVQGLEASLFKLTFVIFARNLIRGKNRACEICPRQINSIPHETKRLLHKYSEFNPCAEFISITTVCAILQEVFLLLKSAVRFSLKLARYIYKFLDLRQVPLAHAIWVKKKKIMIK